MYRVIILLIAFSMTVYHPKVFSQNSELERLLKENENISALSKYKDSEEVLKLKLKNLEYVNKSRTSHGLKPVKLDILASRVANMHCVEMVKYKYMGHWNKRGFKPYHRYAFAGGTDHVGENLYMYRTTGELSDDEESVLKHIKAGHNAFMAEVPPHDGHRKMILVPYHTHVGLGYSMSTHEFRYAEEFLDRYVSMEKVPRSVRRGGSIRLKGSVLDEYEDYGPYAVAVYYEPKPPRRYNYKRQPGSYFDGSNSNFITIAPWKIKYDKENRSFDIRIRFKGARPGYYYIMLYVRNKVDSIPYVVRGSVSMNTRYAIPATSIVVRVK